MLKRSYRTQESLVRYWAQQAVELCDDIDDSSLQTPAQPVLQNIRLLNAPRRIIVIGGSRCGKSSLLGHMVGSAVPSAAEWEGNFVRWRFRCEDGDATASRFLPIDSLEGLELVDTVDCTPTPVQDELRGLISGADVVIAVIDARAPGQSPVWELLAALPETESAACMIALTHTDTIPAAAALELNDTMRQICRERLARAIPVYQVCPTSSQGVEVFTRRVQDAMGGQRGVRAAIRAVVNAAVDLMYKQGSVLKVRGDVARTDSGFLAGIEQEIDNFLAHQMLGVPACATNYADAVRRAGMPLLRRLRRRFGLFLSPVTLLRLELMGAGAEEYFCAAIRDDVLGLQQESDRQFIHACSLHWKHVRPRMKQTLECEIGDFPEQDIAADLEQLRSGLAHDLREPFKRQQVRSSLGKFFKSQAAWMQSFIIICCFLLMVAGLLGFVGQDILAIGAVGVAACVWLLGTVAHLITARGIRPLVNRAEGIIYDNLKTRIQELVKGVVVSRVSAYRRLYTAPRRKVAEHEATLQPLMDRHSEVYRQLRAASPHL
ncbi:MAG: GTPase domain-containing protein [Akkermansia sp.]|nr:GTPase domain-containing protein [Akkermansia sp.]